MCQLTRKQRSNDWVLGEKFLQGEREQIYTIKIIYFFICKIYKIELCV